MTTEIICVCIMQKSLHFTNTELQASSEFRLDIVEFQGSC